MDSLYYNTREAICQAELLLLRMVGFKTSFNHPHKYLLQQLKSLRAWMSQDVWGKYPISETSWSLLQDFYHDRRVLNFDPNIVGVACISLALQTYGIEVPFASKNWFEAFSGDKKIKRDQVWAAMSAIMDVYEEEKALIEPISVDPNFVLRN